MFFTKKRGLRQVQGEGGGEGGSGGGASAPPPVAPPAAPPATPPANDPPAAPAPVTPPPVAPPAAPAVVPPPAAPAAPAVPATPAAPPAPAAPSAAEVAARQIVRDRAIETTCSSLGGLDVKLATKLLAGEQLETEEDGTPKGLKEKLEALLTEFPLLKGQGNTTPANPARAGQSLDEQIEAKYGKTGTGIRIA